MKGNGKMETYGIKSEEIRKALSSLRNEIAGVLRLTLSVAVILAAAIAFGVYLLGRADDSAFAEINQLKERVDTLEARLKGIEIWTEHISQTPVLVEEAVTPTPTPTPTPATTEIVTTPNLHRYNVEVTNFGASNRGNGAFTIRLAVESSNGQFTYEEAKDRIAQTTYQSDKSITAVCNTQGRKFEHYGDQLSRQVDSFEGSSEVTPECWALLEEISGEKISPNLPPEAVAELKKYAGPSTYAGLKTTLLVSEAGWILGQWPGDYPKDVTCLEMALETIGWEKAVDYFPVATDNDEVWKILYQEARISQEQWGPVLPDFCGSASLHPTEIPTWAKYRVDSNVHTINARDIEVGIRPWEGDYLATVNQKPEALIRSNDLVLVDIGFNDLVSLVYLRINDQGQVEWFKPETTGREIVSFWDVPDVYANPDIDGISPWVEVRHGSAYRVGERVFVQSEPRSAKDINLPMPAPSPTAVPTPAVTRQPAEPPKSLEQAPFDKVSKLEAPASFLRAENGELLISGRGSVPLATCSNEDTTTVEAALRQQGQTTVVVWLWSGFAHSFETTKGNSLWSPCADWRPPQ